MNRNRFEGKIALVTGAGSPRGIGRATALALAREGVASDESAYLTGVTLDINGGMHMH